MRARQYLISIIIATIVSLFSYGKLNIFQKTDIKFLNKEIFFNSEMVISLIVLLTLLLVLIIGLIDKFFNKEKIKGIKKEN
tara:strand:- start:1447 stop:1689 length:243 start_codon:yes stop_codon:yes gene_type:complete